MCLVIDTCVIGKVFDPNNAQHERFKPVMLWVMEGTGSVIYGGTKYLKELGDGRYLSLFKELRTAQRAVSVDTEAVDARATKLKLMVPDEAFDDEHIVALVGISKCCLLCTDDVVALPYIKRKDLYPPGVKVPHIYRTLADKRHCCTKLLVAICPERPTTERWEKKRKSRPKVHVDVLRKHKDRR
jgi:hypothetical protein